jgi:hypothetical protein
MVYKRASGEASAIAPKLNLGNLVALQQSEAAAAPEADACRANGPKLY